jgi:hypothetical protein
MLAATSSRSDRTLDTIRLVLLLESKKEAYPATLREYFRGVLAQTVELLNRPAEVAADASSEAVSLAVKMSSDAELRELIVEILRKNSVSQEQAEQVLVSLETSFDPSRESAHFSKAIYAAI